MSRRAVRPGIAYVAVAATAIGVLLPWTHDGPVRLDGLHGANNGWLILIVAGLALCWMRGMARGSLIASAAVFGCALVIGLTAVNDWVDARRVLDAHAGAGLIIVVVASVVLASMAAVRMAGARRAHRLE